MLSVAQRLTYRLWAAVILVAVMLLPLAARGLSLAATIRPLTAGPLVALAVGDQIVHYVGVEITQFPLCVPWAIGEVLTMKCSPGVSYSTRGYLRVWQGRIAYYSTTRDIQAQSTSVLFVQSLP